MWAFLISLSAPAGAPFDGSRASGLRPCERPLDSSSMSGEALGVQTKDGARIPGGTRALFFSRYRYGRVLSHARPPLHSSAARTGKQLSVAPGAESEIRLDDDSGVRNMQVIHSSPCANRPRGGISRWVITLNGLGDYVSNTIPCGIYTFIDQNSCGRTECTAARLRWVSLSARFTCLAQVRGRDASDDRL
jgi:hypothetical protein